MDKVTIFEMAPRDGLQNERKLIATKDKVRLVDCLSDCGFSKIEVTSFVSPKWVPQMGDAADVMAKIKRARGIEYAVLTPNLKGLEGALDAHADEVAIFASGSESFSQKNINCSIAESIERFVPVLQRAKAKNLPVRGYISCVTNCPYEGEILPSQILAVAKKLINLGCYEISLGDTIGHATPERISDLLKVLTQHIPAKFFAGHYHDTKGRALDNISASLEYGLRVFDASVGGLGGCPYAPGAKGNVATEKVASLLHSKGYETGLAQEKLTKAAEVARSLVAKEGSK